ncbi:polysaccharide deacetylase family protein [Paenibacillus sp. JX-17]|uniref:Polysaccharide deacetylase family protein n=1 Tax=Paenibacillus lacisoli TaxID=3064525 RepID=A0ABT9CGA5_9BACL|nr:polysaccharide deacetylase [Paenibacillus sp. JX-17]MDO7908236.1 polysaccharide deacetylase family protein [Paenibacillus sp. JX-17]
MAANRNQIGKRTAIWCMLLLMIMGTFPLQAAEASEAGNRSTATGKIVYLTFDDGPGKYTGEVLDILHTYQVKATFFMVGQEAKRYPELVRRVYEEGHAIGNHSYNHRYSEMYDSFVHFWKQIKQTEEILTSITGSRPSLVRAPGGTYGHFDHTYFNLLKQGGYQVFDWNVDSGDSARRNVPAAEIKSHATLSSAVRGDVILLMHDGGAHRETVKALPAIIEHYRSAGYQFGILSEEQEPVQFRVAASLPYKRLPPDAGWVKANVEANAELFARGPGLTIEAGAVTTELQPGEYRIERGQYVVPLRKTVERLGGTVTWNRSGQEVETRLGHARLIIPVGTPRFTVLESDAMRAAYDPTASLVRAAGEGAPASLRHSILIGETVWFPLRELLEKSGYQITGIYSGPEARRVKAQEISIF